LERELRSKEAPNYIARPVMEALHGKILPWDSVLSAMKRLRKRGAVFYPRTSGLMEAKEGKGWVVTGIFAAPTVIGRRVLMRALSPHLRQMEQQRVEPFGVTHLHVKPVAGGHERRMGRLLDNPDFGKFVERKGAPQTEWYQRVHVFVPARPPRNFLPRLNRGWREAAWEAIVRKPKKGHIEKAMGLRK